MQVRLRVGAPDDALLRGLQQFAAAVQPAHNDGVLTLHIDHERQLPLIAQWLVEHDYTLYELSPQRP